MATRLAHWHETLPEERNTPYERTKLFRAYEPGLIPGLFQTTEYASAIIAHLIAFNQIPNDLEEAVAARMERQRVLHTGDRRFLFVLEEQALRTRVGDADVMANQLNRLLEVMPLHRISLGIIPAMGQRPHGLHPDSGSSIDTPCTSIHHPPN